MKGSDLEDNKGFVATPFSEVNSALGGGIAVGKITEVAGSWSVGKSTFAYQVIGAAQKQGRPCLLLDAERAYTKQYGESLGVDNATLDIFRAKTAEEYLDHSIEWMEGDKEKGVKGHKGGLVVCDAIGALLPKEEAEKTSEGRSIGLQARLLGSYARKLTSILDDNEIAFLALNHTFIPLGQMGIASSGGMKWAFARAVWLVLSGAYGQPVKKDSTGLKTLIPMRLEVKKNKIISNMGMKIDLSLIQGAGFVGDTVSAPLPRKKGRPKG